MSVAPKKGRVTKSARAGITFPIERFTKKLRKGNYADRIGSGAGIYITAVLEYLSAEIIELAGQATADNKKKRIIPRYIMLAIKNDAELNEMLGNVIISESGVVPHINQLLIKDNSKKSEHAEKSRLASEEY